MTKRNTDINETSALDRAMGELLRAAGARVTPDPERMARVKSAVREEWQQSSKNKFKTQRLWLVGSAAAVAASILITAGLWQTILEPVKPSGATLEILAGTVIQEMDGEQHTLTLGDELLTGATIKVPEDSGVALRLASNQSLRVRGNSEFELLGQDELLLNSGSIYVDSGPDTFDTSVLIQTPFGRARDIGTQFTVTVFADAMQVSVREGRVEMGPDNFIQQAQMGEQVRIDHDGATSRRSIAVFGEQWNWVSELTPYFDPQGKTLAQFLEWVCRENGWTLKYTDPVVRHDAEMEELAGADTKGMTTTQALTEVLKGTESANEYNVLDDGVLMVGFFDEQ